MSNGRQAPPNGRQAAPDRRPALGRPLPAAGRQAARLHNAALMACSRPIGGEPMPDPLDPRPALERVLRDPKAKPADIVKAAELLRALGAIDQAADVLDLDDASLLRLARGGGGDQNEGPVAAGQSRVPLDAVGTQNNRPLPAESRGRPAGGRGASAGGRGPSLTGPARVGGADGTQTDPSFYADPPAPTGIDPLS